MRQVQEVIQVLPVGLERQARRVSLERQVVAEFLARPAKLGRWVSWAVQAIQAIEDSVVVRVIEAALGQRGKQVMMVSLESLAPKVTLVCQVLEVTAVLVYEDQKVSMAHQAKTDVWARDYRVCKEISEAGVNADQRVQSVSQVSQPLVISRACQAILVNKA